MNSRFVCSYPAVALGAALSAALLVIAAPASAQEFDFDAVRLVAAPPGQNGGQIGMVLRSSAAYLGSDERYGTWRPVLDYQGATGWFAGTTNGIGLNLARDPALQFGLRLTLDRGRDEERSVALKGWGEVKPRPEIGAFFNHAPAADVLLTSSVRYGSGNDRRGLVVDLGAGVGTPVNADLRLGVRAMATVANASYMQSYFGVSAAQSGPSGLSAYTPGGGWRDARAVGTLSHRIDPALTLSAELEVRTLLGDAKASPVTRQRTATSALLALSYAI